MGRGIYGLILKALRANDYRFTVVRRWQHTPTMVGVRFHAPEFLSACHPGEGEFIRGWFPDPEDQHKLHMRGYTVVDIDATAGECTIYFLLHEPKGPASTWAASTQPGDEIVGTYYSSKPFELQPTPEGAGYVIAADAASIPYTNALLGLIPHDVPVRLWLMEWDASDREIPLDKHPNATVEWIPPACEHLERLAEELDLGAWRFELVLEAQLLVEFRKYLLKQRGMPKERTHYHAYWSRGKAMGTSRSFAAEE